MSDPCDSWRTACTPHPSSDLASPALILCAQCAVCDPATREVRLINPSSQTFYVNADTDKQAFVEADAWPQSLALGINVCKGNSEFSGCVGIWLSSIESGAIVTLLYDEPAPGLKLFDLDNDPPNNAANEGTFLLNC